MRTSWLCKLLSVVSTVLLPLLIAAVGCTNGVGKQPSASPGTQPAATSPSPRLTLHLIDPKGAAVNNVVLVVPLHVGWPLNLDRHAYWPDKAGMVNIEPIDRGVHWFIVNSDWRKPTLRVDTSSKCFPPDNTT